MAELRLMLATCMRCQQPTHARLEGKAAAAALVAATRLAAITETIDRKAFCSAVADVARLIHPTVATAFEVALPETLDLSLDEARALIVEHGVRCNDDCWSGGRVISACAVQAVLWAVAAFLRHPQEPLECICVAIEGGGDADTTAAMAGAIVGARCGVACMPEWIRSRLTDRGKDGATELSKLVGELHALMPLPIDGIAAAAASVPNLFRAPHEVAEEQARAATDAVTRRDGEGGGGRTAKRLFDDL